MQISDTMTEVKGRLSVKDTHNPATKASTGLNVELYM